MTGHSDRTLFTGDNLPVPRNPLCLRMGRQPMADGREDQR